MGYLYLSWISVKMSPCQPCQLVFVTSICCFCKCLHLYPQGPSTQGTFTPSGSRQALPRHCQSPPTFSTFQQSVVPSCRWGSCILSSEFRLPHPTAPEAEGNPVFPGNPLPFLHCKQVTVAASFFFFFLENFSSHTWGEAPKASGPQGHLLGPL